MLRPRTQLPGKSELLEEVEGAIAGRGQGREPAVLLDGERDVEVLGGGVFAEAFRPFDDDDAVAVLPDFLEAELAEVGGVEAVQVEVEEWKPAFVLMQEGEGGASDAIADVQPLGQSLRERGLARSEVSVKKQDVALLGEPTEERSQALGRFGVR